jgi:hypothetical protein
VLLVILPPLIAQIGEGLPEEPATIIVTMLKI